MKKMSAKSAWRSGYLKCQRRRLINGNRRISGNQPGGDGGGVNQSK